MHEIQYFMWVNCRTGSCEKREKVLKLHDFAACIRFGIARGLLMHAWSNLSLMNFDRFKFSKFSGSKFKFSTFCTVLLNLVVQVVQPFTVR